MSDIGILNSPLSLAMIALIVGSPGLGIGLLAGAIGWRRHRIWGALIGAIVGLGLWLLGWAWFTDNL
jgi:Na+/proline symporter